MEEPDKYKTNYFLATPVQIRLGEKALGTSAGYAFVTYTLRAWDNSFLEEKKNEIEQRTGNIVKEQRGLDLQLTWSESFRTNRNHPDAFAIIRKAAITNRLNFNEKEEPLTWGEDFGLFTEKFKGAMFGMGAGNRWPSLHNPDYDFPDDLIEPGVKMFVSIAEEIFNKPLFNIV
jgi:metal-dependent amidase/aminoacylase/carboxypeptidase family protein